MLVTRFAYWATSNFGAQQWAAVLLVKAAIYVLALGLVLAVLVSMPWLLGIVLLFGLLAFIAYLYLRG